MRSHSCIAFLAALLLAAMLPLTAFAQDFRFETYFKGRTEANGSFRAITGFKRTFKVGLVGRQVSRTVFTLEENFRYADGERDRKTWRLVRTGPNSYAGTREDVVGTADIRIDGPVATFSYDVYLDGAARKNRVRFHDRMVLREDGTVLNTATVTKFGLPVAWTRVEFTGRR